MARSIKIKSRRKLRKSRKQQGGGIHYDQYLQDAKNNISAAQENYSRTTHDVYGSSFWAKAEDPIRIPGNGMYIGKYYLWNLYWKPIMSGPGMLTSFETDKNTGLPKFIKEGDWKNNKENGHFIILYGNGDVISSVHMKNGFARPSRTKEGRKGEGDLASEYIYSNGQKYEGDLILKSGKIVPANDLTPPRTVFNFAPGPEVVFTGEGKTIKIPPREAERGFRMSQDPDFEPPAPQNSPRNEPVVVRRGPGLRGRLSGIRESRSPAVAPMDREEELEYVRGVTAMQTKKMKHLTKKDVLPPIPTRKGGNRRHDSNSKKTRKNRTLI
jgi:hypothetical protein